MVGFTTDFYWFSVGTGDFLHSFFSTIAYNLEDKDWGSRFPLLMLKLYQGKLEPDELDGAAEELKVVQSELRKLPISRMIWDIEDLSKKAPWGDDVSEDITDLSNYYVTNDGEDLIEVLFRALKMAKEIGYPLEISPL